LKSVLKVLTSAPLLEVHWEYQNDEKQINEKYSIQKPFVVTTDGKLIEEHHGLAATANPAIYCPYGCPS
jgi:hypothetical protein